MLDRLAKLVDVKSLMTLALTGGFIGLTLGGSISGEQFLMIYTTVVAFYFGTVRSKLDNNSNSNDAK